MTVLALDTTSEHGSLVVRRDGRAEARLSLHAPQGFSHQIFGALDGLLKQARVTLADVDIFAAASGPGSFTGVRVGLALVKGLAEAAGKGAAGIPNLRALSACGVRPFRAVLIDARRGDTYAAVYDAELHAVVPQSVGKLENWLSALEYREYEFISHIDLTVLSNTRFANALRRTPPVDLADAVALCAERDGGVDPAAIDANYVRQSDAELFWRDR